MKSARELAFETLQRVWEDGAWAERALAAALSRSELAPRDKGLVSELVYGTLRHQIRLDFVLNGFLKRPIDKSPPAMAALLRMGAYQLLEMRIPSYSAVNESVELAKRHAQRQQGAINGVLRSLVRAIDANELPPPSQIIKDPLRAMAVETSHPDWLLRQVSERLGLEETRAFADSNNETPDLVIRVNTAAISVADYKNRLAEAEIEYEAFGKLDEALVLKKSGSVQNLPGFEEGEFIVQDPAAQLVGLMAQNQTVTHVLDLCAAPGGKTTHLAARFPQAQIVAVEKHLGRARLINENVKRLGLLNVQVLVGDVTEPDFLPPSLSSTGFDLVVLDAPCSGSGTLRRHPELRRHRDRDLAELVSLQQRLLRCASRLVGAEGELIYSVCSVAAQEGRGVVSEFLKESPGFVTQMPESELFADYQVEIEPGVVAIETWPHRHHCDGFFAARLVHKS